MDLHMEGVVPSSLTLTTWNDWGFESFTWKMLSFIFYWGDLLFDSSFLITHAAHSYGIYHHTPWNLNLLGCHYITNNTKYMPLWCMSLSKSNETCGRHFEHMRQESNRTRNLFTLFVAVLINKVHMRLWDALYLQTTLKSHWVSEHNVEYTIKWWFWRPVFLCLHSSWCMIVGGWLQESSF